MTQINEFQFGPNSDKSLRARNFEDLRRGFNRRNLILKLSLTEIVQRYRNTFLGPLWLTISLSIFLAVLGYVGGAIFNLELRSYFPYLCLGVIVWTFISTVLNESGVLFISAPLSTIMYDVPMSTFVFSFLVKNLVLFGHNFIIYIFVAIYFEIDFISQAHLAVIGVLLLSIFALGISLILSVICVRMRDIPQIITNLVQVSFFVTPVMWRSELLIEKGRNLVLELNPFYYLIEVVRAPLIGDAISLNMYVIACGVAFTSLTLGILVYIQYRHLVMFYR